MKAQTVCIPVDEQQALAWLGVALDSELDSMPHHVFVKAWCAVAYLYPGLHPDDGCDHGTEIAFDHETPERFAQIDARLINPYYTQSGWPVAVAPMAQEAWRRHNAGQLNEEVLYASEAQLAGFDARATY